MALGGAAVSAAGALARAFSGAARGASRAGRSAGQSAQHFDGASHAARGLHAAFSGLTAVVGLAIAGISALVDAVRSAAKHLNAIGEAARQSGGSPKEMAALMAAGFSTGEIAARASALAQQLATDPTAAMYGQQMGVRDYGGVHGAVDQAANLAKLYKAIEAMGPGMEQTRMARMYGMEDKLGQMNAGGDVKAAQNAYAALNATIADSEAQQAALDISEAWRIMMLSWQQVIDAFGKSAFEPIKNGLLNVGEAFRRAAEWFNANPQIGQAFGRMIEFVMNAFAGAMQRLPQFVRQLEFFINMLIELFNALPGPNLQRVNLNVDAQFNAIRANTNATQANTRANEEMRRVFQQGMFGGGPRAQAALGKGWQGLFLAELQMSGAWKQGVFGL